MNSRPIGEKKSVAQIVLDSILKELRAGTIPWHRPWLAIGKQNLISKKLYNGVNRFILAFFDDDYFLTFKQAHDLGGRVKRGAKSIPIVFWKFMESKPSTSPVTTPGASKEEEKDEEKPKSRPMLRYYSVFMLKDTEGIKRPVVELKDNKKDESIEEFIARVAPKLTQGGSSAHYSPLQDSINLPEINKFDDSNYYYCTLFHELIHWTENKNRCNRFQDNAFNHSEYGKEELVAEVGAAILCNHFGISLPKHNASYCACWLKNIEGNETMLISACNRAEKAIEFLFNTPCQTPKSNI